MEPVSVPCEGVPCLPPANEPFTLVLYCTYLVVSVLLTVWVARTLHKNGRIFLVDTFDNEKLADSVNHLLVVGFYLINIGYVTLALKTAERPGTAAQLLEVLCSKVGYVLVVLGIMHFFNLFVFSRMRRRSQLHRAPPPVVPQEFLAARG